MTETTTERQPTRTAGFALAATIVAFGFAGSRLLGVVRTVAIADTFGSSADLSAYWVACLTMSLPTFLLQSPINVENIGPGRP